jgi:hypothetical protein
MFDFLTTLSLKYAGDCSLLGIGPDLTVYVEESHGDDDQLAQHQITLDGQFIGSVDEVDRPSIPFRPLQLPLSVARPAPIQRTQQFNFAIGRYRGLREPERIADLVRPLDMATRFYLAEKSGLGLIPPQILGLAESRVLAETPLGSGETWCVCQRLRIAYSLLQPRRDAQALWYDYDTLTIYLARLYMPGDDLLDLSADALRPSWPGVTVLRPLDCLATQAHLFIAEGGSGSMPSRVHIWRILPE